MRVYLPATLPLLRRWHAAGELGPAPITAFAVTPALREWYVSADAEELEYAASTDAARAALRLLHRDPTAPRRRAVLAADVPVELVTLQPDLDRAVVRLAEPVPLRLLAAILLDDTAAAGDVRAAAAAVLQADLDDADAQFVLDGAEDHQLCWYAVQELPELLADESEPADEGEPAER